MTALMLIVAVPVCAVLPILLALLVVAVAPSRHHAVVEVLKAGAALASSMVPLNRRSAASPRTTRPTLSRGRASQAPTQGDAS